MSKKLEDLFAQCIAEGNNHVLSIGTTGVVHLGVEMRRMQDKFGIGIMLDGKFHLIQQLDLIQSLPMGKYRMGFFFVPEKEEGGTDLISV